MKKNCNVTELSNEQLVIRIQSGIDVADNMATLYRQNKGMLARLANWYKRYAEFDDLMQEGYIGLSAAVDHFEQERDIQFITYAVFWIRQSMLHYIEKLSPVSISMYQQIKKHKRFISQFESVYGRKPDINESCHFLGVNREQFHKVMESEIMTKVQSLDCPVGEDETATLCDTLTAEISVENDVLDKIQREELKRLIWSMVDQLKEEQQTVIRMRYQEDKTLKEIGQELGKSPERIRIIEGNAFREFRKTKNERLLRPFLVDYIYTYAYRGSVDNFNRTWTSSTEYSAMKLIEMEDRYGK